MRDRATARARARSLTPTICDRRLSKRAGHAGLRGAVNDGATRIAANYKFALSYVFSVRPQVRRPPSLLRAVLISAAFGRLPQSLSSRMTSSFRRTSLNISSTTRALWFARVFQRFVAMGVCAFLHAGALLLQELDPTLFIISAWNDNGLKGKARGDRPPHGNNATRRVTFR